MMVVEEPHGRRWRGVAVHDGMEDLVCMLPERDRVAMHACCFLRAPASLHLQRPSLDRIDRSGVGGPGDQGGVVGQVLRAGSAMTRIHRVHEVEAERSSDELKLGFVRGALSASTHLNRSF
jgi:hypothetical protein